MSRTPSFRAARAAACFVLVVPIVALACTSGPDDSANRSSELATVASPIINGQLDTTHTAVVAVLGNDFSCSGTIIQVAGGQGYVLTAGHCCPPGDPPQVVVIGNDFQTGPSFDIVNSSVTRDSCYTGCAGSTDDVCMLRFSGADGSTPVIPAMTPQADALQVGTQVTYVGYGITSSPPGGFNSHRRSVTKAIGSIDPYFIEYADPGSSGTCEGDSGGPGIVNVAGVDMVAGVTSFGDLDCVALGASIRTSKVYTNFIAPYLADQPPITGTCPVESDCNVCLPDSTNPQCGGGCANSLTACSNDAACGALLDCYNGCSTLICQNGCTTDHVAGLQMYEKIQECVCNDACSTACGTNQFCTSARCGTKPPQATLECTACTEANCCEEAWACSLDNDCKKCFLSTPPADCGSKPNVQAYYQCVSTQCAGVCTLKDPNAGATTTAATGVGGAGAGGGGTTGSAGGSGGQNPGDPPGSCSCRIDDGERMPAWPLAGLGIGVVAVLRRRTLRAHLSR